VQRDGVGAVTERTSAVELRGDPGHGDQSECGGDKVELQVTQPGQIMQMWITHKVDRYQGNNDLVHGRLLHPAVLLAYSLDRREHQIGNASIAEVETESQ
jgi:hypothetical protein